MHRTEYTALILIGILFMVGVTGVANGFIISEVAWAGTAASSTDEWIELRNVGDEAVDLLGWQLVFGDTFIPLGEVAEDTLEVRTPVLGPGDFFVLERTNDDSISDIAADLIYKGSLSNTGLVMELRNPQGDIVDSVAVTESGWPAGSSGGDDPAYCTMERTSSGGWATNIGVVCNGLDADGEALHGTPGQMNSSDVLAQWAPVAEISFPSEEDTILSGTEWITWTATDPNGTDSALAISIFIAEGEEGEWVLLVENLANMGSFSWDTTTIDSGEAYCLLLQAEDSEGFVGEAESCLFEVTNPSEQ